MPDADGDAEAGDPHAAAEDERPGEPAGEPADEPADETADTGDERPDETAPEHGEHVDVIEPAEQLDVVAIATAAAEKRAGAQVTEVVDLSANSVLVAFVAVVAVSAIIAIAASGSGAIIIGLGALFAFALDPVVVLCQERFKLRRGYAVAILIGASLLVMFGVVALLGQQTVEQARSFQDDLPRVVNDLGTLPLIGDRLVENKVPERIEDWAAALPKQLAGDTSQITNAAETVTSVLVEALGVVLVMVALLVDGPWLASGAQRLIPPQRRITAHRLGAILGRVIGRYFAGSLLLATLQGIVVLVTGLILGVPLSPLLAVWAAVWNMVPQIGGAIGGVVFVLVAFTQGATTGVIAGVVFIVYLTFANNTLLPVILGRAVDISPLTTMVATIAGFSVGGVVGAMVAVPILGAGKAMYFELRPYARSISKSADKPPRPGVYQKARGTVSRRVHRERSPAP